MEKREEFHKLAAGEVAVPLPLPAVNVFSVVLVLLACIGGFLFGYDTGIISGSIVLIADDFDLR